MEYVVGRVSQHQMVAVPHHQPPPPPAAADHPVAVADHHRPPPVRTRRGSAAAAMTTIISNTATQQQEQEQEQSRRQALEQEVWELKQQLCNEETVHEVLERALQPSCARPAVLTIPAFIPTKAKELLAELLLVEEEIARLEAQIQAIKQHRQRQMPPATPPPQHMDPEIKSMFFISQAMAAMDDAGDYLLNKHAHAHAVKSPIAKAAAAAAAAAGSPKSRSLAMAMTPPPSRRSLDKKPQQHELPITTTTKATTNTRTNRREPNKLSERIVKCLLCIFIRLHRSSRAADLEKSAANLAGSRSGSLMTQQGQGSSFRMDTALVNAAAKDRKDRGQQDHYGVFAVPDAIVRDIGPYKNLVSFTSSSLDLRGFSTSPLLTKLREMLEALQQLDLRPLNHHQKLAFWLNVYNTCIMHGILQHGLPSNSEKLLALKNKATINVSGQKFNALVIENFILRQPSSVKEEFWRCDVDVEEQQVRELYGLKSSEPNILFALCCGIRSSPALRVYKADRVAMDLEKAKLEYLQASLVVTSTRRLMIPSLIHSNMHDFAKDMESLLRWICEQLPTSWSLRKSMVDCLSLRSSSMHPVKMEELVDVIPFDYEFQYLLPM
ncbi:unnamed protein product [Urochloa decumbens]|uniref:Uncharacterized protein n=1 Tax=Urochloa decumbens TaxID=240449 RepID=A0ABC8XM45_9POAL